MIQEKIGGGVESGTATVNNTYISSGTITWEKSGNVVQLHFNWVGNNVEIPDGGLIASDLPIPKVRTEFYTLASLGGTQNWKELVITAQGTLNTIGGKIVTNSTLFPMMLTYIAK